jgi:hypothetical protein
MGKTLAALILAAALCPAALAASPDAQPQNHIVGDYVEARTASVFAGPCHFNAELTTTGREAEMAWHVREGVWNGTSLDGLTALASVVSQANLKDEGAGRRSVLFIDSSATEAQAAAFADAVKVKYGKSVGEIVAVKRMPIKFAKTGESYRVNADGLTKLTVDAMPNHACCTMPNLVWYKPLVELKDRRVGYTRSSGITDKTMQTAWEKNNQNTAFYGEFSL